MIIRHFTSHVEPTILKQTIRSPPPPLIRKSLIRNKSGDKSVFPSAKMAASAVCSKKGVEMVHE